MSKPEYDPAASLQEFIDRLHAVADDLERPHASDDAMTKACLRSLAKDIRETIPPATEEPKQ